MQTNTSRCLVNAVLFLGLVICGACSEDSTSTAPTDETRVYTGSNGFIIDGDSELEQLSFDATSVSGISSSIYERNDRIFITRIELHGRIDGKVFVLYLANSSSAGRLTLGEHNWTNGLGDGESISMNYDGFGYLPSQGTTTYTRTDNRLQGSFSGSLGLAGQTTTVKISGNFDIEHQIFP